MSLVFATVRSKQEIFDSLKYILSKADEGYEASLSFDASGYGIKVIGYTPPVGAGSCPPPDLCKQPLNAPDKYYELWRELWGKTKANFETGVPGHYLSALDELGFVMAVSFECPFDDCAEELKTLFCFYDGVAGLYFYLYYKPELNLLDEPPVYTTN